MKKYELEAQSKTYEEVEWEDDGRKGKVIDLIIPVLSLIFLSILSMLYTGGLFEGASVSEAFANCDAILGLAMGAAFSVIVVAILYLPRKIVSTKEFLDSLVQGFNNMVPATLILVFAWTLGGICGTDYLNAGGFVGGMVAKYSVSLNMMPAIFFVIALLLAFSTGTSWGTFAILLPITISVFGDQLVPLTAITTAAVLGGAVCGDHISPISDTTILSSTGAGCDHLNHVSTQMQYGLTAAAVTFVSYIIAGLTENKWIGLVSAFAILIVVSLLLRSQNKRQND